jgi:hypothetical protein
MTTTPIQIPQQPPDDVLAWLRGRTIEQLGAIDAREQCVCRLKHLGNADPDCPECNGSGVAGPMRRFFPDALRYRDALGKIVEEPVYLVIPREDDYGDATDEAVEHVAKRHPKATVKTPAQAREAIGEERFYLLDIFALVSLCVRNRRAPHARAYKLNTLLQTYEPSTLNDAYGRIRTLERLWDVRVSHLTEDQFWALCAEIARVKNTSPFVVLAPALHEPCIARLASELHDFRTCKSCSGCKGHSTPE